MFIELLLHFNIGSEHQQHINFETEYPDRIFFKIQAYLIATVHNLN